MELTLMLASWACREWQTAAPPVAAASLHCPRTSPAGSNATPSDSYISTVHTVLYRYSQGAEASHTALHGADRAYIFG